MKFKREPALVKRRESLAEVEEEQFFDYERDIPVDVRLVMEEQGDTWLGEIQSISAVNRANRLINFFECIGRKRSVDVDQVRRIMQPRIKTLKPSNPDDSWDFSYDDVEDMFGWLQLDPLARSFLKPWLDQLSHVFTLDALSQRIPQDLSTLITYGAVLYPDRLEQFRTLAPVWAPQHIERIRRDIKQVYLENGHNFLRAGWGRLEAPTFTKQYRAVTRPAFRRLLPDFSLDRWNTYFAREYEEKVSGKNINFYSAVQGMSMLEAEEIGVNETGQLVIQRAKNMPSHAIPLPTRNTL